MDDTDRFFTLTIVGAPLSALLGRRAAGSLRHGIEVGLVNSLVSLGETWRDKLLLGRAEDRRGRPRRQPGSMLRWLERHALLIALGGLVAIAGSGVGWGVWLWT